MSVDREERRIALAQQHEAFADLLHAFFEWRHKVMTRFAVVTAALAVGAWSLMQSAEPAYLTALLLMVAALVGVVSAMMDRVNQDLIEVCYEKGSLIEDELGVDDVGVFHHVRQRFDRPAGPLTRWLTNTTGAIRERGWLTYRFVLGAIYLSVSALSLALAVIVLMTSVGE